MSHGPSFWFDTRVYLTVAATLLTVIVFYNHYFAILGVILLYVLYMYGRERHLQQQQALSCYLDTVTHGINQAAYCALRHLPLAIMLIDHNGNIYWMNDVAAAWTGEKPEQELSVYALWPEFPWGDIWGKSGERVLSAQSKYYQIIYRFLEEEQDREQLLLLYVADVTEHELIRAECAAFTPVLAHIQIDNYDDVLHGLNENQRTVLLSEVNKCLMEWVSDLGGFLKKYAEDMYLAVLNRQSLDKALQDRFDVLDKVRAIHGGNKIPVTLSMGVAADEPTTGALGQRAQAGLDLALGRGGDQVAVHVDGKVQFYGGKAKAVEKNTRVKARIVSQALHEIMDHSGLILAMGHGNEDFDCLGASLGIFQMARHLGKPAHIVVGQPGLSVNKLEKLLLDYEEYRDVFITPDQAMAMTTTQTLLVVVDTHRPEMTVAPELLGKAEWTVVVDHHRRSESFIANPLLIYLEPSASSACELVTELLMYFDETMELTRLDASALFAGIVVDTKNFAVQTGVRTFEAASYLRRAGADPTLVKHLFCVDFDTVKARSAIMSNTEMLPEGIVIAICPPGIKNVQLSAAQAADMLLRIEGVRVCFVLFMLEEGGVGVSARSNDDVNVQVIMEHFGGGGHQTVAGAQVKNASAKEVKAKIIELSTNYIRESESREGNSTARG